MNNWLIGLSEPKKTDEDLLQESIERYTIPELNELMWDMDPSTRPTQIEDMQEKIASAVRHGRELAHENGDLTKIAFIPALVAGAARLAPMAGRALAGGGAKKLVGGVAKDMAVNAVGNGVMGALKPQAPAAAAAGQVAGGFKYAFVSGLMSSAGKAMGSATGKGGLLQRAAGYAVRNPGTALTAAGAVGGAAMAPRDEQGNKQYLRGAMMGGGIAAGANALSGGSIANKMRAGVMNPKSPALGQGTRNYLMDSAAATKGRYPKPMAGGAAPATSAVPASAASPQGGFFARAGNWLNSKMPGQRTAPAGATEYRGGPTMGAVKVAQDWEKIAEQMFVNLSPAERICLIAEVEAFEKRANQQTLHYDPATKTFIRIHAQPSMAANQQVQGGTLADLGAGNIPQGHREPVQSFRARGTMPPPIPAAARRSGIANAIKARPLPSMAGAVSLVHR
jgi:hypothetical protein